MLQSNIQDPHSFSNPHEAFIKHIELDLSPDFETKQFTGLAKLHVEKKPSATHISLDIDELAISAILVNGDPMDYQLGKKEDFIGQELIIPLEGSNNNFIITVEYKTSPDAKGLIWRTPEQTDGKIHPLVYSHSQPTYASSIYPAQHSPMQRYTYEVTLRTPKDLMGLMSAPDNPKALNPSGEYRFNINKPIPSYLCSLAVGDFRYKQIGTDGRTGIYAEPVNLERAHKEFSENDQVLELAEKRFGTYIWDIYNILILPVDYPAGAMEHPWLSYFSNEYITGKKDRVRVVYHELSHSWFGNLVTAGLWGDLWLNEGLTTYGESALAGLVTPDLEEILCAVYYEKFADAVKTLPPELTCLKVDFSKPDLNGKVRNPRDNFSPIAYYKGFLFFKLLEQSLGLEKFNTFIKVYLEKHAFQSVTTEIFETFLTEWLKEYPVYSAPHNLKEWLYEPGFPANTPMFSSRRIVRINELVSKFMSQGIEAVLPAYEKLINIELEYFIVKLARANLNYDQIAWLNQTFKFDKHPALNIRETWLLLCANKAYTPAYPALSEYVLYRKKPKLVANVFDILVKTEEGKALAKQLYHDGQTKLDARGKKAAFDILVRAGMELPDIVVEEKRSKLKPRK